MLGAVVARIRFIVPGVRVRSVIPWGRLAFPTLCCEYHNLEDLIFKPYVAGWTT